MKKGKVAKIDYSRERLASLADKYYNEGKYLSALRLAYKELELFGGDGEVYARFSDIYEGMDLHLSAINYWYRFLDEAMEEDLPDAYEGLAVNYLRMGNETQSAYYYNKLIDADDTLPEETKLDIVDAFAKDKREKFRFVYPPRLADFSKELDEGSAALKTGNCKRAVELLSIVEKGSKDYAAAREMQAVAYLLDGDTEAAKRACLELLEEIPNDVRVQATLAAVYLEEGNGEASKALALRLYAMQQETTDELYKVATVCCENGLHEQAYDKFCEMEQKAPFDGRMLYFKGVAAYKCGKLDEAEKTLDVLCTVYPDAEVAKYYLQELRAYKIALEDGETDKKPPEFTYFYHLPQEVREERCRTLIHIGKCAKDEAQLFGLLAWHDGYFRWCFDEMDGSDHDLQYLALATAAHVRADDFLREALLDCEVIDLLKIETLRILLERNEEMEIGVVLCHIYRKLFLQKLNVGRKKRKRFVDGYAQVASKFIVVSDTHAERIKNAAEKLYRDLEKCNALDLVESADDCACAIFLLSGLKELKGGVESLAKAFDANADKVRVILAAAIGQAYEEKKANGEEGSETD